MTWASKVVGFIKPETRLRNGGMALFGRVPASRMALLSFGLVVAACASPAVTGMKVHIQNGEYQDAIHLADSVIAAGDSLDAQIWLLRGNAQGTLRDWEGASESFFRAWEIDPALAPELADFWFVFYNTAAIYSEAGDIQAATQILENGKRVVPTRPEFDQMLGDIALGNQDYDLAVLHFETASDISDRLIASLEQQRDAAPEDQKQAYQDMIDNAIGTAILSYYNAAMLHKSLASMSEEPAAHLSAAETLLSKALAFDPTNADVLSLMAQVYLLEGDFEGAMRVFDEALAGIDAGLADGWLSPEDAQYMRGEIMLTRGVALLEMEQYEQSVAALESAREYSGDSYVILGSLAQARIMMEDYENALAVLETAVTLPGLAPDEMGNLYYMRFAALTKMERDVEAADALEMAIEFVPGNPEWWEYLASTYSRLGRRNDAIEAMETAQEIRNSLGVN